MTSKTEEIASQRRRWQSLRSQFRIGFEDGKIGRRYRPGPSRYFNRGYFHGWIEGHARFLKRGSP